MARQRDYVRGGSRRATGSLTESCTAALPPHISCTRGSTLLTECGVEHLNARCASEVRAAAQYDCTCDDATCTAPGVALPKIPWLHNEITCAFGSCSLESRHEQRRIGRATAERAKEIAEDRALSPQLQLLSVTSLLMQDSGGHTGVTSETGGLGSRHDAPEASEKQCAGSVRLF